MPEWWRGAVLYEVYVHSFADSDGDGLGGLTGETSESPPPLATVKLIRE